MVEWEISKMWRRRRAGIFSKLIKWFLFLSLVPLLVFGLRATKQSHHAITSETENFLLIRAGDIAERVALLLRQCEKDLRILKDWPRTAEAFQEFAELHRQRIWSLADPKVPTAIVEHQWPLYKEVSFVNAGGLEQIRIDAEGELLQIAVELRNVSHASSTRYRCETYFNDARPLRAGEIFVSHLTGFPPTKDEQLGGRERVSDALTGQSYDGGIRFTMPVDDASGQREGYLCLLLDQRHLQEIVAHIDPLRADPIPVVNYESGNYLYLTDDEGWFIAHPKLWDLRGSYPDGAAIPPYLGDENSPLALEGRTPLNLGHMGWKDPAYPKILETLRQGGRATLELPSLGYGEIEPVMRFRAFAPIDYDTKPYDRYGIFGGVALGANSEAIDAMTQKAARELWLMLFVVGFGVVVLATVVSRDIARPLVDLAGAARDIGAGNLKRRLAVHGNDEIAEVTEAFNRMAESLRESQERLRQAERFASIGEVVSGTAHAMKTELNLYGLINNLAVLERLTPDDDPRKKMVSALRSGVEGLEHIVHELLDSGPEPKLESIPIHEVLADVLHPLEGRCRERNIRIERDRTESELRVMADRDLLHRVFANIVSNALDAMPNGGDLFVSVRSLNGEVLILVRDTGVGIPEELLEKIFYPFFTTKKDQGGSGFGLYQSQRALRRMNGRIELQSTEGQGTTVNVYLPRV